MNMQSIRASGQTDMTQQTPPESPKIIGKIPKLSARWAAIVVPFILSCLMSGIISCVNMLRNLGWFDGFIALRLLTVDALPCECHA